MGFDNFLYSFITLFRCSTGEDWHRIMFDFTRTPEDNCTSSSCGNSKVLNSRVKYPHILVLYLTSMLYYAKSFHSSSYGEL